MLPTPDFNFVVCGIATIAASVGYACARKVRPLPSRSTSQHLPAFENKSHREEVLNTLEKPTDELNPNGENIHPDLEAEPAFGSGDSSLKRKRSGDLDVLEGYPHNLKSIYPNKRRSGSVSDQDPNETKEEIDPAPTTEQPQVSVADSWVVVESESSGVAAFEPSAAASVDAGPGLSDSIASLPAKQDVAQESPIPEAPKVEPIPADPPRFVFPQSPPRITQFPYTRSRASPGFASFAGSSSLLHGFSPAKDSAPVVGKPIWVGTTETAVSAVDAVTSSSDADHEEMTGPPRYALAAAKTPALATQTHLTGEEEEDVTLELKGVKLFVKRGDGNFSGGMVGHIKVLSHRTTRSKRLLFRREPLGKVSMNVRMQPTVRFSFDAQENILRVALKELKEKSDPSEAISQTVIYAFKPGRSCRRCDFQEFAESLLAQARAGEQ